MRNEDVVARARVHLLPNYKSQPIAVDRGLGVEVWDVEGRRYLDMLGGIAVCALGHCHPQVVAALKAQADRLWHYSNVFYNPQHVALAEKLCAAAGLDRAFFCNSGAEANEALLKLARKVQKDLGRPERYEVIAFDNSFHGRTLATLAATGQTKHQAGFEPMPPGFVHVPFGDVEVVRRALGPKTAAILVECIQGEGGVRLAPEGFVRSLRSLCDEHGLLLLIDEVQTGMGRTGKLFAFQHEGVRPDGISLAKALGNGFPIGAMLCTEKVGKSMGPGTHGSTFGGNALATAVAGVVLELIGAPGFLEEVRQKGEYARSALERIKATHSEKVVAVRGRGLLLGVEVNGEAGPVIARCRERGLLVNAAGERTVRLAPPLVIFRSQIDEGIGIFEQAL